MAVHACGAVSMIVQQEICMLAFISHMKVLHAVNFLPTPNEIFVIQEEATEVTVIHHRLTLISCNPMSEMKCRKVQNVTCNHGNIGAIFMAQITGASTHQTENVNTVWAKICNTKTIYKLHMSASYNLNFTLCEC